MDHGSPVAAAMWQQIPGKMLLSSQLFVIGISDMQLYTECDIFPSVL